VIAPDDAGYDEARTIFPGGIDRRPAVIVRPTDATDVAHVVSLARERGQELAVRSGGHSIYSVSEGGIVLDLSDMKELQIEVEGRTAWAETGWTAVEYTTATGAPRPGDRLRRHRLGRHRRAHARRRCRVPGAQARAHRR